MAVQAALEGSIPAARGRGDQTLDDCYNSSSWVRSPLLGIMLWPAGPLVSCGRKLCMEEAVPLDYERRSVDPKVTCRSEEPDQQRIAHNPVASSG